MVTCEWKPGGISHCIKEWKKITSDPVILDLVEFGATIEFIDMPVQQARPETHVNEDLAVHLDLEVQKFLDKGIIVTTVPEPGDFYSTVFLREKKDGLSYRMIINLKPIKSFIQYRKFKMDTPLTCMQLVTENGYMAALDLKDAYYSVRVHPEFQKFLKFIWRGVHYKFVVLAMGLACAPRLFTKLTKPVIATLQKQGHTVSPYLDDLFICGDTFLECKWAVEDTMELLAKLGLCVNVEKSTMIPVQRLEHLGFVIDTREMHVTVSESKLERLETRAQCLYEKPTIRQVMQFLGTVESCRLGVHIGNLYKHVIEAEKNACMKAAKGRLQAHMSLSPRALHMVQWWVLEAKLNPRPLIIAPIAHFMQTDASKKGWGACVLKDEGGKVIASAGGAWTDQMKERHINVLELDAIRRGLAVLLPEIQNTHVLIETDNTTAAAYMNRMGGVRSEQCRFRAELIWQWLLSRGCWATTRYLPGEENCTADRLSRKLSEGMEWQLQPSIFQAVCNHFQVFPQVDLFASEDNAQLPIFFSFQPQEQALGTDAFLYDWGKYDTAYVFCPFSVLPRVLQKVKTDGANVILIAPVWTTAVWWANAMKLLRANPLMLPAGRTLLRLTTDLTRRHQLLPKMRLVALHLTGQSSEHNDYQQAQGRLSLPAGRSQRLSSTTPTWPDGNFFVLPTMRIPIEFLTRH